MAMPTEKKIWVAVAVLAGAGFVLWVVMKNASEEARSHAPAMASAALPELKIAADDVDKVTKIAVHQPPKADGGGGASDVTLEKDGDKWKLTAPLAFPANQQNVKSLLDNLKELKAKETIDTGTGSYGQFDLDDAKALHVTVWKGADKAQDLYFGKSGGRGQTVRVGGKDGIWVASGYSSYLYARDTKGWRDTEILKFEDANVVSVSITNENGAFGFSKNGDTWSGAFKKKPLEGFDAEKVKDMLRSWKALSAEDFGDGKPDSDTGLDKPVATVTIELKDNAGKHTVHVGKTSSGTSRYARKEGSDTIYVLGSWTAEWATGNESKFRPYDWKPDGGAKDGGGEGGKK